VRTKAQRRIDKWLRDVQQWAIAVEKQDPKSPDAKYAFGVVVATNVALGRGTPFTEAELDKQSPEAQYGYIDGMALISKVATYGDAPLGKIADLLAAPHGEPLEG